MHSSQFENPLSLLRQLKGAPISVLLACYWVRQAVSHHWLAEQTGYSDYAVTRALAYLTEQNFLARVTGGWMITVDAIQLPLMAVLPTGEDFDSLGSKIAFSAIFDPDVVVNDESEESQKNKSTSLTNRAKNRVKRDFQNKIVSVQTIVKDPDETKACLAALRAAGIHGQKAEKIAQDHHITVEDIHAHALGVQNELWDNPQGMMIYRLLNHVPPPEMQENGHVVGCRCEECQLSSLGRRYSNSKFDQILRGSDDESEEA